MSLRRPPLVEVWMSFQFQPATAAPPWDRERYELLLDVLRADYPNAEEMARHAVRLGPAKRSGKPQVKEVIDQVLAVRAYSESGLRAIHLWPDRLVVNYLRGDSEPYPGFPALLEEAVVLCRAYSECYHPVGVVQVALHYVDVVELPVPASRVIRSEDYLTLNLQFPEAAFGAIGTFDLKAVFYPVDNSQAVQLGFSTLKSVEGAPVRPFRLEWHTGERADSIMTEDEIRLNLRRAHDRLETCFRQSFTPAGWALFEPDDQ